MFDSHFVFSFWFLFLCYDRGEACERNEGLEEWEKVGWRYVEER